jgi:crotonobetainyl-CoA:carnitine CoA-transferase CaiB-like acyl-CoA transferase
MGILTGITVIELCEVYQGPLAGQSLGDFGARVIKVEFADRRSDACEHYAVERNLMSSYSRRRTATRSRSARPEEQEGWRHALLRTADVLHNYRAGRDGAVGIRLRGAGGDQRLIYGGE